MTLLKRAWEGWKRLARKIGDFNARIILSLFYFLILGPFSILVRLSDPLHLRKKKRGWTEKTVSERTPLEQGLEQW